MTKETAIEMLKDCATGDVEMDHVNADAILCALLNDLGYGEVVEEWHKVRKWYA